MKTSAFPLHRHRETLALLPWYANGTLSAAEHAAVEAHVAVCLPCRGELGALRALAHAVASAPAPGADIGPSTAGFERLRARLVVPQDPPRFGLRLPRAPRWTYAVMAAQAVLLLGVMLVPRMEAPYRTLSTPPIAAAPVHLRVVFDAALTEGALRTLLQHHKAEIVAGPSRYGVYTLAVPAASTPTTLSALRANPGVRFAEPASYRP